MVEAGKVTLRVEVDAKQFKQVMKEITRDNANFKKQIESTEPAMKKMGDTATTTAVRFQTLTQGTINLVTSFTQAYTSISNLQKAKTSLQAAAVGVERAIDLQKRKQFQLNQEMRKAVPDYQKIELITRELETAHDDLAVKQLRVKDATEQVKDTYVLFALNIANVGFSAVQTGVSMIKMAEGTKVASWAVKNLNFGMGKWALIATALIVAYEGIVTVISRSNKEMYEQYSIIGNINKLMREWGTSADITLDNYNTKLEYGNTQTQEFNKSWEDMTSTVKTQVSKQKSIADEWASYWSKKTKEIIAEQRIIMGNNMEAQAAGGTQGNFSQAQQGESGKSDFQKQLDEIWDFLISPPLSGQVAYAEPYIKNNLIIHNKNGSNVLAVDVYNQMKNDPNRDWAGRAVEFGRQLRGYSGPDISSGTAINIDPFSFFTGLQQPSGNITIPDNNFTSKLQQQVISGLFNPEQGYGVPSSSIKLTTLEDYKKRYEIIKKASHELNQNIGLYQSDPNMGRWVVLSGELIKQELFLEEEIARLEADVLGKPMPKKKPKNKTQTIEELKKKHLEKYPSLSKIISSDKIFRGNMRNITNDAIISHFSKFQNRYSVLPTEYGKLISKGSLMLASGSSLREDAGRYGQFRFNFLRGSGAAFFGGHAGEFIANYQLNTNIGFGSDSRAIQTFEYAQLLSMGVAGLDPQRRRLQSDRTKHRISQGFRPPSTSLRGLVETGAINILLDNQQINTSMGAGLSQSAIDNGATWQDYGGITGGAYRFQRRNNQALQMRAAQIAIEDRNRNRMKTGGRRVLNEDGTPMYELWDDRAVEGGFSSISAYRANWWRELYSKTKSSRSFLSNLGISPPKYQRKSTLGHEISRANRIRDLISKAGLSITSLPSIYKVQRGGRRWISQSLVNKRNAILMRNQANYSKADEIVSLIDDYGLPEYYGSSLQELELQAVMREQDELFKSVGLNRTEAFRIIDTQGRGRNEIEDRVRWTQRNESISTGNIVL